MKQSVTCVRKLFVSCFRRRERVISNEFWRRILETRGITAGLFVRRAQIEMVNVRWFSFVTFRRFKIFQRTKVYIYIYTFAFVFRSPEWWTNKKFFGKKTAAAVIVQCDGLFCFRASSSSNSWNTVTRDFRLLLNRCNCYYF